MLPGGQGTGQVSPSGARETGAAARQPRGDAKQGLGVRAWGSEDRSGAGKPLGVVSMWMALEQMGWRMQECWQRGGGAPKEDLPALALRI